MSRAAAPWWLGYRPLLFSCFDPCETYLAGASPQFRDATGVQLVDVDSSIELLLLGYGALREIGGEGLPSKKAWKGVLDHARGLMRGRVPTFDIRSATLRGDSRIESMKPFSYSRGSLDLMLLQELILDQQGRPESVDSIRVLSCLLSLMWLDTALEYLLAGDAFEGVEYALRAREILANAKPQMTQAELRRELARASVRKKLAQDPKQRMMRDAKALWQEHRTQFKSKASLARYIQDKLPDLESEANLVRRMGDWEEELGESGG